MFDQDRFQSERLVAVFADVWFDTRMERHVAIQIASESKDPTALVAHVVAGHRHVLPFLVVP